MRRETWVTARNKRVFWREDFDINATKLTCRSLHSCRYVSGDLTFLNAPFEALIKKITYLSTSYCLDDKPDKSVTKGNHNQAACRHDWTFYPLPSSFSDRHGGTSHQEEHGGQTENGERSPSNQSSVKLLTIPQTAAPRRISSPTARHCGIIFNKLF